MAGRILVIKLGALGDFLQAAGPFAAIRAHHPDAHITLLTTRPFADFAAASPWFDKVWTDVRPKLWQFIEWMRLRGQLNSGRFNRVYDLQTSDRSSGYYRLFGKKPEWSGIARSCSHPHANPRRDFMHTMERQAEQLKMAGIDAVPAPNFSWVDTRTERFGLAERHALLAPVGALHRPEKRWPKDRFAELANWLQDRGVQPVLLGTASEARFLDEIVFQAPGSRSLAGETSLPDLIALGRGALAAIGNDTGPMHAAAMVGCPTVVVYSKDSDPALCAQRGPHVSILRRDDLETLELADVTDALSEPILRTLA